MQLSAYYQNLMQVFVVFENDKDRAEKIKAFDERYRYAETIEQQRLNVFLTMASILLLGCSYGFRDNGSGAYQSGLISLVLAVNGVIVSILWYFLGTRQKKFQDMLDIRLKELLEKEQIESTNFPIFHILDMKGVFTKNGNWREEKNEKFQLSFIEHHISNRLLVRIVPLSFLVAFLFVAAILLSNLIPK